MKISRQIGILLLLLFCTTKSFAQNGAGESSFQSSQLGFQSAVIGLGGYTGAYKETQSAMYLYNPALLDTLSKGQLAMGYTRYIGRTNATELAYSFGQKGKFIWGMGFKYLGFGKNDTYDANGNNLGTWSAADFSLKGVASYQIDSSLQMGASLQQAVVQMPQNSLTGTFVDVGFYYKEPESSWSASLLFKGMGVVYAKDQISEELLKEFSYREFGSIVYLNDNYSGGHTYYPNYNFDIKPEAGKLAVHPGDPEHLHGVSKIEGTTRYTLAAFWSRNKDYFDDWVL
jgi:hypothetical protein